MTVENVVSSIERALATKSDEPLPRISRREAMHITDAAEQGAGPAPMLEPLYVASFALGAGHIPLLDMVEGTDAELPSFGMPGTDYRIDDDAAAVFEAFFRKYSVPLGEKRQEIIEEMREQVLSPGKGRAQPPGTFYRVPFTDHRDENWTGHVDPSSRTFFLEKPGAGRRGESVFYGEFVLDRRMDAPRR